MPWNNWIFRFQAFQIITQSENSTRDEMSDIRNFRKLVYEARIFYSFSLLNLRMKYTFPCRIFREIFYLQVFRTSFEKRYTETTFCKALEFLNIKLNYCANYPIGKVQFLVDRDMLIRLRIKIQVYGQFLFSLIKFLS